MLKKNDCLELKIEGITNLGFGVGRHEGLAIFISGAVTGDLILAKIIKVTSSFAVGRLEKLLSPSPLRDGTRCHVSGCTSCAYKMISYAEELKIKEEDVRVAFKKCGLSDITVEATVPSPKTSEYRNKAQYPVAQDKAGNYLFGFYAPKSHRVTEARDCPLLPSEFGEILNTLEEYFKKYSIPAYDEESGSGIIRHIYIRRGEATGEVLLTLVIAGDTLPAEGELSRLISERHPSVVGLLLNINKRKTNVILGERYVTLFGRDHIYDVLAGVRLKLRAPAFYQVNHDGAELLYAKAKELCKPKGSDTLLDIYCGAGSIGLSMAGDVRELIGIEIVEGAVECAKQNAEYNGVTNAKFFCGDASKPQTVLNATGGKCPDVVVIDPPRKGSTRELVECLAELGVPKVVYVSCDATTLARDCVWFREMGYDIGAVQPVDMFPRTGHVESVVCLTRK